MKKGRAQKYGESLAFLLKYVIDTIPQSDRINYTILFFNELNKYSFENRCKGHPINEGCIREIDDIDQFNVKNPEHLAKLIKESIHLMYQKGTSKRVMNSLSDKLKELSQFL